MTDYPAHHNRHSSHFAATHFQENQSDQRLISTPGVSVFRLVNQHREF